MTGSDHSASAHRHRSMMKHPEFDQMVALAERLRLELDSSDRKNLVGSQIIPDKSGGLNGSTQHQGRSLLAGALKAKLFASIESNGTLPWLGFDREQPNRSLLPGKQCRINALDGVASTI